MLTYIPTWKNTLVDVASKLDRPSSKGDKITQSFFYPDDIFFCLKQTEISLFPDYDKKNIFVKWQFRQTSLERDAADEANKENGN